MDTIKFSKIFIVLWVGLLWSSCYGQSERPNVILIMADDLGFECLGANGCDDYSTPNLDALAASGCRFTNCFSNPICTPSRVKIMTGMFNVRNYVRFGVLDRNQTTFGNLFKAAGYATCIAGKWQLGSEKDAAQHFGFDQACLWQHTRKRTRKDGRNDSRFNNPRVEINGEEKDYNNGEYGPDVCADFICDFIDGHKKKPFLAYFPMLLTHCPFVPTPGSADWDPKSKGSLSYKGDPKNFAAMVQHMDKIVGRIVAKLEEHKLRENTLLIFTGDNGTDKPIITSLNGEKIGFGKGKLDDNGTRVPLIVSYPGKIKSGMVSDALIDFSDFLPTLCEASSVPIAEERIVDGVSFWSTLRGQQGRQKPWSYIWWEGKVLARTKTHAVRRFKKTGPIEFFDCSVPYKPKLLAKEQLKGEAQACYQALVGVIHELDQARPESGK